MSVAWWDDSLYASRYLRLVACGARPDPSLNEVVTKITQHIVTDPAVQQIRTLLPVTCKLFAALGDVAQFVKYLEWDHVNAKAWGTITYLLVLHVLAWPGKAMRTGFDLCLLRPNNTDFIVDLLRPEFPVSPSFVASLVSYGRTYQIRTFGGVLVHAGEVYTEIVDHSCNS